MNTQEREYWADRDCTVPVTQEDAFYEIKNKQFTLLQINTKDPIRNQMVPMTLKSRESVCLQGSQLTKYIWDLRSKGFISVEMLPADDNL